MGLSAIIALSLLAVVGAAPVQAANTVVRSTAGSSKRRTQRPLSLLTIEPDGSTQPFTHQSQLQTVASSTSMTRKELKVGQAEEEVVGVVGENNTEPSRALEHFIRWSAGAVSSRLEPMLLQEEKGTAAIHQAMTAWDYVNLLRQSRAAECAGLAEPGAWSLHETSQDAQGVRHALLVSPDGRLQYVAERQRRLLAADPAVCARGALLEVGKRRRRKPKRGKHNTDGELENLHKNDGAVKDCVKLFKNTLKEDCHKTYQVQVLSATINVIDGFEVHMAVKLAGRTMQQVNCAFEVSQDHKVGDLLEVTKFAVGDKVTNTYIGGGRAVGTVQEPDRHNPGNWIVSFAGYHLQSLQPSMMRKAVKVPSLPLSPNPSPPSGPSEVGKGLFGKVVMSVDLCEAEEASGLTQEAVRAMQLMEERGFGELSRYKGYEHVNDGLPWLDLAELEPPAVEFSLEKKFPKCFPPQEDLGEFQKGMEVVRDQGSCGSCWAFAGASAAMANICVSAKTSQQFSYALRTPSDRYEISVQQIMSCNKHGRGCDGGYITAVDAAFEDDGIAKESDVPYLCGGGDSRDHFEEQGKCKARPWGRSCPGAMSNPDWNWYGAYRIHGEKAMMQALVSGRSLFTSIDVYQGLLFWEGSNASEKVYSEKEIEGDKKVGGHAVVTLGYGKLDDVKYWIFQNSWGPGWGHNGYCKFQRGVNFAGCEGENFVPLATVKGAARPKPPEPPRWPAGHGCSWNQDSKCASGNCEWFWQGWNPGWWCK